MMHITQLQRDCEIVAFRSGESRAGVQALAVLDSASNNSAAKACTPAPNSRQQLNLSLFAKVARLTATFAEHKATISRPQRDLGWPAMRHVCAGQLGVLFFLLATIGCDQSASKGKATSQQANAKLQSELKSASTPASTNPGPSPFQLKVEAGTEANPSSPATTNIRLNDVAAELDLKHVYQNGERGRVLMVETIGAGIGWLDFDNDGRWDLVANQGGDPVADHPSDQPTDELFQLLDDRFVPLPSSRELKNATIAKPSRLEISTTMALMTFMFQISLPIHYGRILAMGLFRRLRH